MAEELGQPDFHAMSVACGTVSVAFGTLSDQFDRCQNLPTVQVGQSLQQTTNMQTQLQHQMQTMQGQKQTMQHQMETMQDQMQTMLDQMENMQNGLQNMQNSLQNMQDQIQNMHNDMCKGFSALGNKIDATECARKAMVANRAAIRQNKYRANVEDATLVPLRSHLTNEVPEGFPATVEVLNAMESTDVNHLLTAYEQSIEGPLEERTLRLKTAIGVL